MLAGSVALLGLIVMVGWFVRVPALVQVAPGFAAMTFGTAFCFTLTGFALLSLDAPSARAQRIGDVIAVALLAIAGAMLSEHLFDIELGVDLPTLHAWLLPASSSGRMSPNTALGFLLSAICLLALQRAPRGVAAYVPMVLAWAVIGIGLAALAGYVLGAQYLYRWYGYASVALHTAVGLAAVGLTLYLSWRDRPWRKERVAARPDAHIAAVGAGWLMVVALTAGLTGFVIMQQRAERNLDDTLSLALRNRIELFESLISLRAANTTLIATRPAMLMHLRHLVKEGDDVAARAAVANIAASFLPGGFSAVAIYDVRGAEITRAGHFAERPELVVPLRVGHDGELVWQDGFILRTRVSLMDSEGVVGSASAEQPLPILTRSVDDVADLGATGDAGLCGRRDEALQCFPQHLRHEVFAIPLAKGAQSLPVALALEGKTGVTRATDYRGKTVVAAYAPVGSIGLGMSLKVDAAEIYQPVRDRLALFAMLLLAMIGLGAFALRAQIKPLATELVRSQQALRGQSAELARANAELTQALQTRDRFLATMSHELRTPLNAILGFSGTLLLKMPGPLTGDQEKQLGIIQANGKHLLSLINDLLDIAQIESGKVAVKSEPLVVQEVIDHVVEALRPMAESKALRLDAKVPTTDVWINTDRRALLQIVMNLASNAIKYTERGSVLIELVQRSIVGRMSTEISVSDTGVGIKEEDQIRLFHAFQRVGDPRSHRESSGLGLYLSRRLADLIDATISFRSTFGAGSTFTLSLAEAAQPILR